MSMVNLTNLPEDLLAQIFKRLPKKDLSRCRYVQKSWYYFIQTPKFITMHSNYRRITTNTVRAISFFDTLYVHRLTRRIDNCPYWYAQSSDLLICKSYMFEIHNYSPNIYMWNPVIQTYDTLPPSPLPSFSLKETLWRALAFGFVSETNDHVVVHIVKYRLRADEPRRIDRSVLIGLYSLSTNSWRKIRQDSIIIRAISTHDFAFVNGAAYWIGITWENYKILVCFDTKKDMLRDDILLPDCLDEDRGYYDHTIYPYGQSIAYFLFNSQFKTFDMWVLKGPPDELSWEKKMSVCMSRNVWTKVLEATRSSGEPGLARVYNLISSNLDN